MSYSKIIITGSPGTGKSSVADMLRRKLKIRVIHINDYAKKNDLVIGKQNDSLVVNMNLLKKMLNKERGIIEGHLACEFKLSSAFVIVLRCNPKVLRKRLKSRGYSKKKIKDNLEAEALDYCTQHAEEHYKKVFEVDTTKRTISESVGECVKIIRGKSDGDSVDFSDYFMSS